MLTEIFAAAIQTSDTPIKGASNSGVKDGSIFLHSFQPHFTQRSVLKKSSTVPNGLAVSAGHIFAAQADKAVINVYGRERGGKGQGTSGGTLEAVVPIQERAGAIALAADDTVLVIGTESGRVLLWETISGRLISPPTSHLRSVSAIAVSAASEFLLTGSADANIHVFSLPNLLSFSTPAESHTRLHTLSLHRGAVTSLVVGKTSGPASIAVSASEDKTAIIWDYRNGNALRTYLLGDIPRALVLDPADRACYTTYDDGSVQCLDFFAQTETKPLAINSLYEGHAGQNLVEPTADTRWHMVSSELGPGISLSLSWDGTKLYSGHASGKIASWEIGVGSYTNTVAVLPGKVSNIVLLPPSGFSSHPSLPSNTAKLKVLTVVKPKPDASIEWTADNGTVPKSYSVSVKFDQPLDSKPSEFRSALESSAIPESLLSEGLAELASWRQSKSLDYDPALITSDEVSNDLAPSALPKSQLVKDLQEQLESLRRVQKVTFRQLAEMREEREHWIRKDEEQDRQRLMRQKMHENAMTDES